MNKFNPYIQGQYSQGPRATVEIIGGKAKQLLMITPEYVPYWIVITSDCPDDQLSDAVEFAVQDIVSKHIGGASHRFAVRSSATSEDGDSQSYAGIFESKLHVPITEVYSAVQQVRQSAKDSKVKAYSGTDDTHNIAVLIMPMVKAHYSGVLFSKEPVEGTDKMLLEWDKGVGGVVDGTSDTSHAFLGTGSNITEHMTSYYDGRTIKLPELDDLPVPDVIKLWNEAKRLENNYNQPVDIEWAIASDLKILQVRPITTLGANNGKS
jgi:phosphoenolpyruvate synthase/pyruvate phosphate dikinase